MRKDKKRLLVCVTIVIFSLLFSSFAVFGHSGRTDSNGGHYDRQTGGYHYHTGGGGTSTGDNPIDSCEEVVGVLVLIALITYLLLRK